MRTLFRAYPQRTAVGLSLMASQAFFYNAIFFTYALILTDFYGVPAGSVGWYLLPFAAGNFLGPLVLGRLFDTIGRKTMIGATYAISGLLLAAAGYLFARNIVSAQMLTLAWMIILLCLGGGEFGLFDVSEIFPLEIRALAIAFYAVGTGVGGAAQLAARRAHRCRVRASVAAGYFGSGADGRGGAGRMALGHRRGAPLARTGMPAADVPRLIWEPARFAAPSDRQMRRRVGVGTCAAEQPPCDRRCIKQ
jgi:MFS family permease